MVSHLCTPRFGLKALVLTGALVVSVFSHLASAQSQPSVAQARVMSKSVSNGEAEAMASQGQSFGQQAINSASSNTLQSQAGGPKGAGCTNINGKCVDNEELMGRGYDQARADKAGMVDGKMSTLETYYNEESSKTKANDGPEGAAWRVTEESADKKVIGRRELAETDWSMTRNAQAEGRAGTAQGMGFEQCTTTSTVTPGTNPDAFLKEQQVCEVVTTPGEQGKVICTRERVPTANQELEPNSTEAYLGAPGGQNEDFCQRTTTLEPYSVTKDFLKTGELEVSTEVGGLACTRNRWAEMSTSAEAREKTADLGVNTEAGGLSCSREIVPENSSTVQPQTKTTDLPIDNQAGGNLCKRVVWPVSTSSPATGTKTALLTVNEEAGGLSCTRTVWPTNGSSTTGATQDATLAVDTQIGGNLCKREVWPIASTTSVAGGKSATIGVNTEAGGVSCTRTVWPTAGSTTTASSGTATLAVDMQSGGNLCKREVWPVNSTSTTGGSKTVNIGVNTEAGGVSCTRTVWPTASQSTTAVSQDAVLSIDTQANTNLCTREVWPTSGSASQAQQKSATLSLNNQVPGTVCTRTRVPAASTVSLGSVTGAGKTTLSFCTEGVGGSSTCTGEAVLRMVDLSAYVAPGTTVLTNFGYTSGNGLAVIDITQEPSAANGWKVYFQYTEVACSEGDQLTCIKYGGFRNHYVTFQWGNAKQTLTWSLNETGNCSDSGTANCPTQWSCTQSAPTTLAGVAVTTADVQGLPLLYPGSSNICVKGQLDRVCGGTGSLNNSISIAADLAPGTTSISGFGFNVTNPQSGVAVVLTQVPSAANSWVAVFRVDRTIWTYKTNPQIVMYWNASSSTVDVSKRDTGNCGAGGTANCPASWSCTTNAPTTINGITVTTAMAGQVAPLFPGASSTCARGQLNRVCSGTASTTTTVNLASRMPAGTTSISGLGFSVLNPQSGVAVTMTSAPTSANGWVATFRVDRTAWASQPAQPNIRITWNASSPSTALSVVDSGDCADPGSSSCPTSWSCSNVAPFTVNGISVTAAMAATQAPLFPGASSSCVVGKLSRTCSGSAGQTTSVSIAADLPAGTTTISNFQFTVNNPQSGVTVGLTQTPSAANSWVAIFSVTRTAWASTPTQPNLTLSWDATAPSVTQSLKDTGNCSATGTANCAAQWSCQTPAPTTINGITVTTAMASALAPMYPGASSTCARGSLDKVCSGTASVESSVNLSSRMPAGTTSISNFAFTVTNPQSGVAVVQTQVPTAANGWVAKFRVDRTNWGITPVQPTLTMTWNSTVPSTNLTVVDSGNCADAGSPSCPTSWSCSNPAPFTVNGISVTAAMAATQAPLFPGASSSCVVGKLTRVCGGSTATTTSVSIADQLPAGTLSIANFTFTVTNPQAGITVSLTQTPAKANNWVAVYSVNRDSWASTPVDPALNMTWNATVPSVNVSTQDTGNCAQTGSVNCPAAWSCTAVAPTTINGITVDAAMAAQVAPLFPGAGSSCTRASLDKTCSGTASTSTTVSLAARMPAGTTSISNLAFTVLNPQAGVSVLMTSAPTLANNWVVTYRVDRTGWASVPANPNIRITWNATTPTVSVSVKDVGDCSDTGSTTCPTSWSCSNPAPYTVNGISVTAAMAAQVAPLFPGAASSCVVGKLDRVCTGSATVGNTLSIADKIPEGVTAISNFGFVVQNPQAGVAVSLVSLPTLANGWSVTFNITRSGVSAPPAQPQITMSWNMNVPGVNVTVNDSGDCAATGTAQCPAVWSCEKNAPTTANGITVTTAMAGQVAPLYPGASAVCAAASLDKVCGGTAATQTSVSIASQLPAGVTSIENFGFVVNNPQPGVAVSNTQVPSAANSWVAIFSVSRTDFATAKVNPNITLSWNAVVPTVNLKVVDTGSCGDVGSTSCPTQWQCVSSAPTTVAGIAITAAMAQTKAPLFTGAPNTCVKGELNRVCSGASTVGTTVSISELVPAGVHSIQNFAFTNTNPKAGVSVSLVSAPTEGNGWMASFNVTRTEWTQTPVAPQVKITFTVDVATPQLTVQDTGDCNDPGSAACPTKWTCTVNAPTVINGIEVTEAMVTPLPALFPSAPATCTRGELNRVCAGNTGTQTTISIADQIAEGTQTIDNFNWVVTNPQASVTVALIEAPTLANGWAAIFSVTRDMGATGVPAKPQVSITWSVTTQEYRAVTTETGDCTTRTAYVAPVKREQTLLAKAGVLAMDMLIPRALARIKVCENPEDLGCDGGGGGSDGGGGGQLPPGEPDPDTETPPTPDAGDACSIKWTCVRSMPGEIDGVTMTQEMLDERGPLFEGDGPPPQCLEATYQRVCENGAAGGTTEVSIAEYLRPGTTKIFNYSWTLIEPGAGVSVRSLQDPALENNWIAKFEVTRTDFNTPAVSPKVKLTWNQPGEVTYDFPIKETGDCSAGTNDEFCRTEWTCLDKAPEPTRPLVLCGHTTTPWYSGAVAAYGEGPVDKAMNLQSFIGEKVVAIERFKYAAQTDVTGCSIGMEPFPPLPTDMRVTQITTATVDKTTCKPLIRFEWDNLCPDENWVPPPPPPGGWGPPGKKFPKEYPSTETVSVNPTQRFLAGVSRVANALVGEAKAKICVECQEGGGGGGGWDGGDIVDEPPLFPGDGPPASCMKAELKQNCEGTWTGTECTINSEGEEVCVTVEEGTPPNNECAALEEDPQCQMIREECTDGAMSTQGWCYVKSRLYECKRPLPGGGAADPIITETTTCGGESGSAVTLPATCMDGSCAMPVEEESVSMSKAGAKMILLQHVMNDHSPAPGMVGAVNPVERQVAAIEEDDLTLGKVLMSFAGIGSARAQTVPTPSNPFAIPSHADGTDQDPTDGTGGVGGSLSGMNIRFFGGKRLDCMKALGGLLNCCKKTPPVDQAPKLWEYMKKNLTQANNAKGRVSEAGNDPGGFLSMIQGASHEDLMKSFTSNLESLMGGGEGGDTNTDSSMKKSYGDFMQHEITVEKPKLAWYCDNDEFELAVGKQTGTCTHLGSYCQTKVLGMCIIKKDRYCCFNSPITRIIREDMDQKGIADLGTAKHPNCDGLTIEQVSKLNLDTVDTDEVEGRMFQGKFNIDIAALQNMSFGEMQSMFDGAKSLIGDETRKDPSVRNQEYVDLTDPEAAYGSLMTSQEGYRAERVDTEASDAKVGLDTLEREVARGMAVVLNVQRTGGKGAVTVRVRANASTGGTAIAGADYETINNTVFFGDFDTSPKKFILKTMPTTGPRRSVVVQLEVVSGDAQVSGNSQATIWLMKDD